MQRTREGASSSSTDLHRALLGQIGIVKGIIVERNTVIHGELTIKRGERPIIQSKNQTFELSPSALSLLMERIDRATDNLMTDYLNFMDAVYKVRGATARKAP